jgi:hypothetical protein
MGFFDIQNLKSIKKMLAFARPGVSIHQIPSEYRSDGREVLRASIQGAFHLDLVEDDREWYAVVALLENGNWNRPGERSVMPLGVKAWAKLEDVAEGYSRAIGESQQIAAMYYSMSEAELDAFFEEEAQAQREDEALEEIVRTSPPLPSVPSTRQGSATSHYPTSKKSYKWVWVVIAVVAALILFGGCGSGGWQMGRDGNGSRVQCVDGSWSNSGGKSGACSWHGGVR